MNIGCGTASRTARARQSLDVGSLKEALHPGEERLHGRYVVTEAAAFTREQLLAGDEIAPGFVVTSDAVEQAPAQQSCIAVQRRRVAKQRDRVIDLAGASQVVHAQEAHRVLRRCAGGALQQLERTRQIAARLGEFRPVPESVNIARQQCVRAHEAFFGVVGSPLLHEIEREIRQERGLFAADFERAAEVPFAGGQVVQLRQDRAEQAVSLRVERIDSQCGAGERLGVTSPTCAVEHLDQLVVGPIGARVALEHVFERLRCRCELAATSLLQVARLQRMRRIVHRGDRGFAGRLARHTACFGVG